LGETLLYSTTTVTGQKNVGEFVLRGIIKSQTGFGLSSGFASISDVNELIGLPPGGFTSFNLYLNSMESIDPIGDAIYASLSEKAEVAPRQGEEEEEQNGPGRGMGAMFFGGALPKAEEPWEGTKYTFTTLNEIMSGFMSLIGVLKTISLVVFIILLVITMVGILNTYRMVMIERTREIGTMRAIGVQKGGIQSIFIWEAGVIALGGALAGLIVAGIIIFIMNFISFSDVTFLSFFLREGKINFSVEIGEVITNLLLLLGLSLLSAYLPARTAARLKPAEALRTEY
jgi:putative ABC transport system permease protein